MIRTRLLQSQHVLFAGYKVSPSLYQQESNWTLGLTYRLQVPHPLEYKFLLRVQTDGQVTPKDAVINACHELVRDLGILSREFTKEYELRKMVGSTAQNENAQQNGTAGAAGATS